VLEGAKEYELRVEAQTIPTKSSGCRLRGGPKISRKIIASRNPDVDLSRVAKSIFVSTDLAIGCVAMAYASAADLVAGADSGGRVVNGGSGACNGGGTCGKTVGR